MSENLPYLDENLSFETRARDLVSRMTLEEKAGQTLYIAPAIPRLGVKAYNWWNEALHGVARAGVATVFPQAIALAAAFDEDMIQEVADVISTEGRAKFNSQQKHGDFDIYKGLTFWSPNVNIFRDPRWGRGHETFGEDPFLSGRLGVRFIRGIQGENTDKYYKACACAKHFAVHSGPEDQRHSFNAVVSKRDLYETYLPAFEACVKEGRVEAVMGAYNRTLDEPCCGSKLLLRDILRGDWGFKGHVVSDCWAIADFHLHHRVTDSFTESAALAMNNGCDLNCGTAYAHLLSAINDGLLAESALDTAVVRLMTARMRLGLFDDCSHVEYNKIPYTENDSPAHKALNLSVSKKTLVLLKNEGNFLPLKTENIRTIGVIGPNADSRRALVGNYEGTASEYVTIVEGLRKRLGDDVRILFSEGCHLYKEKTSGLAQQRNDRLAEAQSVVEASDVTILVLGLNADLEGEEGDTGNEFSSGDKKTLELPKSQSELLAELVKIGKPLVLVNVSGSAIALNDAQNNKNVPAIIQAFYPGAQGGSAVAGLVFGDFSPEGKLPVTFYKTTDELPDFTDYNMANRTYRYMKNDALYPFGYGLSYTKLQYSSLNAKKTENNVKAAVTVQNNGSFDTNAAVQLYVKALDVPNAPRFSLKGLKKTPLKAGEKRVVEFDLNERHFSLYNDDGKLTLNGGRYEIFVGDSQPDARSAELLGVSPLSAIVEF